jgi:hypothetical protein
MVERAREREQEQARERCRNRSGNEGWHATKFVNHDIARAGSIRERAE